jgi:hypothetical protein
METLEQFWPRDRRGCILPAAARKQAKATARAKAKAVRERTSA